MHRFHQPRCPYCGKKVSLPSAWILKTQGEYLCPRCGGISNVVLDRSVYLFAFLTILVSAVFFTMAFLYLTALNLWMLLLVVLPFLLFFLISMFLVRLRKPEVRRSPGPPGPARPPRRENGVYRPAPPAGYPPQRRPVSGRSAAPAPYPHRASPAGRERCRHDPTARIPRW